MKSLKDEAVKAIKNLPQNAKIDDIMYRLYIIDKVRRGQEAVRKGETLTIAELKQEISQW